MSEETPQEVTGENVADTVEASTAPAPITITEERRQSQRVLLRVHAQLLLPGNRVMESRTFDISAGGLGLISDYSLNHGLAVTLGFILLNPHGQPQRLQTPALVANCIFSSQVGGFRLGLIFKQPSPEFSRALTDFLAAH